MAPSAVPVLVLGFRKEPLFALAGRWRAVTVRIAWSRGTGVVVSHPAQASGACGHGCGAAVGLSPLVRERGDSCAEVGVHLAYTPGPLDQSLPTCCITCVQRRQPACVWVTQLGPVCLTPLDEYGDQDRLSPDFYEESETDPGAEEPLARIFVALFDYDPLSMSPNPDAAEEELPFKEGQIIKVGAVRAGTRGGDPWWGVGGAGRAASVVLPGCEAYGAHWEPADLFLSPPITAP